MYTIDKITERVDAGPLFCLSKRGCEKMASKKQIEELALKVITPICEEQNLECVDAEFVKEAGHYYLRIFLDKEGGITVNDCEAASRAFEVIFDKEDPIKDPYILEVSSPGLDRPLKKDKDFERHLGDMVELKLYKSIDKVKEFSGVLETFDNETVTVNVDDKVMVFNRKDIAMIRLAIIF